MVEIVHSIQEINFKLFQKLHYHLGPLTSSWPPKTHFLSKFWRFSPIWILKYQNYPRKLWCRLFTSHHLNRKSFPKFTTTLALWSYLNPPKQHFLSFLSKFLQIFAYSTTITSKLSQKTVVKIVQITQEKTLK